MPLPHLFSVGLLAENPERLEDNTAPTRPKLGGGCGRCWSVPHVRGRTAAPTSSVTATENTEGDVFPVAVPQHASPGPGGRRHHAGARFSCG